MYDVFWKELILVEIKYLLEILVLYEKVFLLV